VGTLTRVGVCSHSVGRGNTHESECVLSTLEKDWCTRFSTVSVWLVVTLRVTAVTLTRVSVCSYCGYGNTHGSECVQPHLGAWYEPTNKGCSFSSKATCSRAKVNSLKQILFH